MQVASIVVQKIIWLKTGWEEAIIQGNGCYRRFEKGPEDLEFRLIQNTGIIIRELKGAVIEEKVW